MTDAETLSSGGNDGVVSDASAAVGPTDDLDGRYRWLTVAWPLALIFHFTANISNVPLAAVLQLIAAILAVMVLLRPRPAYVAVLATVFPVITYLKAPFVGNHELILLFSSLIVLGSVIASKDRWPSTALPILRWLLIIAYASIALSKLNRSFLDPSVSCGVRFADELSGWLGFQVSNYRSLSLGAIWTTVVVESAIPVLLVIRRFRLVGVAVAMTFHFVLALEPAGHVYDFTATLFPLFLAFAPDDVRERLSDRIDGLAGGNGRSLLAVAALMVLIAHITAIVATPAPVWAVAYPAWLIVGSATLWWVLSGIASRLRTGRGWQGERVVARGPLPVLVPVVALLAVTALSPYVELRTATAFNMYSNLETVHVESDHLLFGGFGRVRNNELVMIADAPDDHPLAFYVTETRALPADNLRWFQRNRSSTTVTAEDSSSLDDDVVLEWVVSVSANPPTRLSDLDSGVGGWRETLAHKFGFVRPVDLSSPARCLRTWGPAG